MAPSFEMINSWESRVIVISLSAYLMALSSNIPKIWRKSVVLMVILPVLILDLKLKLLIVDIPEVSKNVDNLGGLGGVIIH